MIKTQITFLSTFQELQANEFPTENNIIALAKYTRKRIVTINSLHFLKELYFLWPLSTS